MAVEESSGVKLPRLNLCRLVACCGRVNNVIQPQFTLKKMKVVISHTALSPEVKLGNRCKTFRTVAHSPMLAAAISLPNDSICSSST